MRRFFLEGTFADTMTMTGSDAHHIGHVLRMAVGDRIIVADSARCAAVAEITAITSEEVTLRYLEEVDEQSEPEIEVCLAQCLPKGDKMEFIVQKAVELGASSIAPLVSENCVVKYDEKKKLQRQSRWQKIAAEAAKQCKRAVIPTVEPICSLKEFLAEVSDDTALIFCYECEKQGSLRQVLKENRAKQKYIVLIGPEGGFSPEEAERCLAAGAHPAGLGSRILRAETASLAALTMLLYEYGELGGSAEVAP